MLSLIHIFLTNSYTKIGVQIVEYILAQILYHMKAQHLLTSHLSCQCLYINFRFGICITITTANKICSHACVFFRITIIFEWAKWVLCFDLNVWHLSVCLGYFSRYLLNISTDFYKIWHMCLYYTIFWKILTIPVVCQIKYNIILSLYIKYNIILQSEYDV